ncbi:hypothetical protein BY996DRAFT_6474540 [Phakopsora pachyrhizi]|nr:hypothetical protein BY996DRAFT_6474540 [Phakopsora pachyrhizi]
MPVKLPKAERAGLGRLEGRCRYRRADDILQGRRRKGSGGLYSDTIAGPTKARIRFGGIRIVQRIRKPLDG